jgi:hypothetical protein
MVEAVLVLPGMEVPFCNIKSGWNAESELGHR